MSKKKIYKKYSVRKRGGQHYWIRNFGSSEFLRLPRDERKKLSELNQDLLKAIRGTKSRGQLHHVQEYILRSDLTPGQKLNLEKVAEARRELRFPFRHRNRILQRYWDTGHYERPDETNRRLLDGRARNVQRRLERSFEGGYSEEEG